MLNVLNNWPRSWRLEALLASGLAMCMCQASCVSAGRDGGAGIGKEQDSKCRLELKDSNGVVRIVLDADAGIEMRDGSGQGWFWVQQKNLQGHDLITMRVGREVFAGSVDGIPVPKQCPLDIEVMDGNPFIVMRTMSRFLRLQPEDGLLLENATIPIK